MEPEKRVTFETDDWAELVGQLALPNDHAPVVILVHGLGSSKDSGMMYGLQHGLAAHGIGSLRIDLFGHGESDGQFRDVTLTRGIKSIESAYVYLKKHYPHITIGLCGHSFGGSSCYYAAPSLDLQGMALIGANIYYEKNRKKRHGAKGIKEWKEKGSIRFETYAGQHRELDYAFFEDLANYNPEETHIKAPLAFFHGDKDKIVPFADSKELAEKFHAHLQKYKGVGHNFDGDDECDKLIHDVAIWFNQHFAIPEEHATR